MKKYVVNELSEMMHLSTCGYAKIIVKKHRKEYDTFDAAKNCFDDKDTKIKYCKVCNPKSVVQK